MAIHELLTVGAACQVDVNVARVHFLAQPGYPLAPSAKSCLGAISPVLSGPPRVPPTRGDHPVLTVGSNPDPFLAS